MTTIRTFQAQIGPILATAAYDWPLTLPMLSLSVFERLRVDGGRAENAGAGLLRVEELAFFDLTARGSELLVVCVEFCAFTVGDFGFEHSGGFGGTLTESPGDFASAPLDSCSSWMSKSLSSSRCDGLLGSTLI